MQNHEKLHILPESPYVKYLNTKIRNKDADLATFTTYSDQAFRQLLIKASELLPYSNQLITTPIGDSYQGMSLSKDVCGVSVIRAGESMEHEFKKMFPDQSIGKILIQRDKVTKMPKYFYCHFPPDIAQKMVFLFEPMLATGGSLLKAIDVLLEHKVPAENIIVVNLLTSPSGLQRLLDMHPSIQIVTFSVEESINDNAFMRPGIGDFGDRYFGTVPVKKS
ncbi:uracil phosphoribosyltransferase [Vibrio sagamiensis]|uniref:Uracil phosphoribosyltransferase n=1 Tax=Vibrio sagamiensis NBRC 104589 TaxID=1219064 RepID=A0A511QJG8_9VIBR|nr:uracil phosphoribosyltransferase [Vibrio sagamiensis]PNQ54166.1 uracil phosphoribosyltransferase [Vibrio agarivorans]GEM77475.1 uracil phosphoribosyltransferase [Vibrio sagamiensis NBRC 104589]